jgi:hypothetical protein
MKTTACSFSVGDPVLVVGRICTVKTCVGLFGYVERIYTTKEVGGDESSPNLSVKLLNYPTFPKDDYLSKHSAEKYGRFDTWTAIAHAADLIPLTDAKALARVNALKAKDAEEKAKQKPDPVWEAKLAAMCSDESNARWKKREDEVKAENERIGRVFTLPGCIKRGDKSDYPTFKDIRYINSEVMNYAARGHDKCTLTERARWRQCLEAIDSVLY